MNMRRPSLKIALLLALVTGGQNARAAASAADAARHFLEQHNRHLGQRVEVEVIRSGTHWPDCHNPAPFLPANGQSGWGRVTVGVRCDADRRARYLQALVRVFDHYWVVRESVPAGTEITPALLQKRQGDISALPRGVLRQLQDIVGLVASRPLRKGSPLLQHQLSKRPLVARRQSVTLVASGEGFRIAREGLAMDEGAMGDLVRVKLEDRQVISGEVTGPGEVSVRGSGR
ncbi:flagellar basal body P-ring formation chaperone FlgA [Microbulbifer harenosus]|uniref:Flagella basal body P-ring formation protein FlgA n=2 Tax=Microbulbifer harenosus TaxID=2576840 RepID=A0ABY2UNG5_9GAMM|nr:flagellar basal body P-ring formation protein FlgA [Microbulbifer harenosus]